MKSKRKEPTAPKTTLKQMEENYTQATTLHLKAENTSKQGDWE
jgi:hypothetical protein